MFTQSSDVQTAIENTLHKNPGELDLSVWNPVVAAANSFAYWEIVSRLMARGFSKGVIDQWDRGFEFQRSLALFWALDHASSIGVVDEFSRDNLKEFDRRDELSGEPRKNIEAVFFTIGGKAFDPDLDYGQAIAGKMSTATDFFGGLDPDDSRIGQPMRL
jgi:hypothetical protein